MSSDLFEERIRTHYQKEHGDTATNYVKNRETKEKLILKFVDLASEDDLSQCVALTGILFSGFCPPDLTNRVADLADYPGPGTQANLNEWVKQIEGLKIRIKVRLGKDVLEKTEFLDWWILFCGVLEEFNSKTAKRCRDDLRIPVIRLLPKQTVLESLKRNMHWIVGSVQQAPLETRLLSGLFDHLTDYVKVLPDHFKDIDFKYSGEYVSFVRNLYRTRPGVASGADFDRLCFEEVEVYLKGLMSKRSLEVLEFEFE